MLPHFIGEETEAQRDSESPEVTQQGQWDAGLGLLGAIPERGLCSALGGGDAPQAGMGWGTGCPGSAGRGPSNASGVRS